MVNTTVACCGKLPTKGRRAEISSGDACAPLGDLVKDDASRLVHEA